MGPSRRFLCLYVAACLVLIIFVASTALQALGPMPGVSLAVVLELYLWAFTILMLLRLAVTISVVYSAFGGRVVSQILVGICLLLVVQKLFIP